MSPKITESSAIAPDTCDHVVGCYGVYSSCDWGTINISQGSGIFKELTITEREYQSFDFCPSCGSDLSSVEKPDFYDQKNNRTLSWTLG